MKWRIKLLNRIGDTPPISCNLAPLISLILLSTTHHSLWGLGQANKAHQFHVIKLGIGTLPSLFALIH